MAVVISGMLGASALRQSVARNGLTIATTDRGTIESTVSASGRVKPGVEQIVTSPISSRIMAVYKRAGDEVKEGEPLMLLDLASVQTQHDQMTDEKRMKELELERLRINSESAMRERRMQLQIKEMAVNRLAMELRNERYLDSIGSGTGDNVRRAAYAHETAVLELGQMRQAITDAQAISDAELRSKQLELEIFTRKLDEAARTLTDARIMAPRRAVLTSIASEIGSQIPAGAQVAVLSELDHYKVECDIADSYGDRVAPGGEVVIKIGKETLPGVITELSPVSRNGVISFTVRPTDDGNPLLRSGMRADVYVKTDMVADVVRLPNGPYFASGPGQYQLYVVSPDGKTLERRKVTLDRFNYEFVEVTDGLTPGESVVISDMSRFNNNKINLK